LPQIFERAAGVVTDGLEIFAIDLEILVVIGEIAEGGFGPEPLAHHARIDVGHSFIDAPADERAEVHEQ